MKTINLKFRLPGNITGKTLGAILGAFVAIIVVFEVFIIKQSLDLVTDAKTRVPEVKNTPVARVNFGIYDQAVKKINPEGEIVPTPDTTKNPFQTIR